MYIPDGRRWKKTKNVVLDGRESEEAFFCIFMVCAIRVCRIAEIMQVLSDKNYPNCELEFDFYQNRLALV